MGIEDTDGKDGGSEQGFATSPYNRMVSGRIPGNVRIFDTTLRDGEQAPGIALGAADKIRIAQALDDMGVGCIEAGFAASSESERDTLSRIADIGLKADVYSLARASEADVDAVADSGLSHVHVFIATSDLHLKYKLRMSREEVLEKAVSAVEHAKGRGMTVQFSCEDATRTDMDYLMDVMSAVRDAGADIVDIPDTVGVISPRAMSLLVSEAVDRLRMPVSVHCHNDLGLAVANSLAAVEAGASMVHVTVNGIGERTGNASLEEVAVNLFAQYGIRTVELRSIGPVSRLVEGLTGFQMPYNKPVVGRNAFSHESGIHVHGVMGNAATYEPFPPEAVGVDRRIVVGKHSGAHSVKARLQELKVDFPEEMVPELMESVKAIAAGDKEIDDMELRVIAEQVLWKDRSESRVVLEEFAVFTGKGITPTATVTVKVDGRRRTASETGVGPVSAAHAAIMKAVNESISLEEYRLSAVTGGSESIAQMTVVIRDDANGGRVFAGRAVGPDVIRAYADAMMEAINRDYATRGSE